MQRQGIVGIATGFALAALCAAAAAYGTRVPAPHADSAPATEFSASRAMRHVRALAKTPRPSGSAAHARAEEYVRQELARLGLTAEIQDATGIGTRYAVVGHVRNVLARLPGTSGAGRGPAVLLVSHYDGVPGGPAAGDAGSGTAVLLETLRALRAGPPLAHDVIALFTDAEEAGLLGAAAFVRDHPWAKDVAVVINFEARGTFGPSFMFETGAGNLDVVRALRHVPGARATSLSTAVYRRLPNDTDLSELVLLEKPALNFAFIGGVQRYHTSEDDVEHLSQGSVQHHGNSALGLARIFGGEPLPRPQTGDGVFFEVPLLGIVVYPESLALPLALLAIVLVVAGVARLRGREPRWARGVVVGALATLAAVVVAGVASFAIARWLTGFHDAKPLGGAPAWSGLYVAAIALLSFSIAAATHTVARTWAGAGGTRLGALAVWALLALLITIAEPGASWLFVWPLIVVATAGLAPREQPRASSVLAWLAAALAIFIIVPTVYVTVGLALGLDAVGATILAVFTALGAGLMAPQLETMRGTRPWLLPAILDVAVVMLLAAGMLTVKTRRDQPVGVSLAYAVDSDSSRAWFTGFGNAPSGRAWVGKGLREAGSGQRDGDLPRWLTRGFSSQTTVAAPFTSVAAPSATVSRDTVGPGGRSVTLRVRAAPGTLAIYLAQDSGVASVSVDGKTLSTRRYRRPFQWPLEYTAPPDSGFLITLGITAGAQPTIGLMALMDTIPPLAGFQVPRRPAGILPYQNGDVTLVYRRLHLLRDSTGK
jgi:hypothetical protein